MAKSKASGGPKSPPRPTAAQIANMKPTRGFNTMVSLDIIQRSDGLFACGLNLKGQKVIAMPMPLYRAKAELSKIGVKPIKIPPKIFALSESVLSRLAEIQRRTGVQGGLYNPPTVSPEAV